MHVWALPVSNLKLQCTYKNSISNLHQNLRGGPFFHTSFTILSTKAFGWVGGSGEEGKVSDVIGIVLQK